VDNFDDNPLAWFEQFQKAPEESPLAKKGMSYVGLEAFNESAANGTLPQVSFIVGPMELSEHPPYMPSDGGWLQQQIVDAVVRSPKYSSTVLMISYDGNSQFSFSGKTSRERKLIF
jgi:phospholipase C